MKYYFITYCLAFLCITSCREHANKKKDERVKHAPENADSILFSQQELKTFYDDYNVDGMMVIEDTGNKKTVHYNPGLYHKATSPASTFNILLALIGLKEGELTDARSTLTRGDIKYTSSYPSDTMTLEEGFTNNRDWFFIRLSTLIGSNKIAEWLHKIKYGNESVRGEANRFWINGELTITPAQQIQFIKDFYYEKLPFSKREFTIVKELLFQKELSGATIFGKRGSNKIEAEKRFTGWFVGYIEAPKNVYFFTNFIETKDMDYPTLVDAQKQIAFKIFETLALQ